MAHVTMTDIARLASVSIATVGRVIHNNGYVSDDIRARVEIIIAEQGYVPNHMARALKRRRSGIIGSLVTYNENALYHKINKSILDAAEDSSYELLTLEGRRGRGDEERLIHQLIGMQVDGLVITSNDEVPPGLFDTLRRFRIPVVAVERGYRHDYVDQVLVRDFQGVAGAVRLMGERGHRHIALIAAKVAADVEHQRHQGYLSAMGASGLPIDPAMLRLCASYEHEQGYKAMEALLAAPNRPTAFLATADTLAAGAMQCLHRAGLRVPEDISAAGYDNVLAAYLSPPIDSVDLAVDEIGPAVMALLKKRQGSPQRPAETIWVDTRYVDRGTVLPLR